MDSEPLRDNRASKGGSIQPDRENVAPAIVGAGGLGGWSGAWHCRLARVINRAGVGSSSLGLRQILLQTRGTKDLRNKGAMTPALLKEESRIGGILAAQKFSRFARQSAADYLCIWLALVLRRA